MTTWWTPWSYVVTCSVSTPSSLTPTLSRYFMEQTWTLSGYRGIMAYMWSTCLIRARLPGCSTVPASPWRTCYSSTVTWTLTSSIRWLIGE
ncbi:hypothetical protein DPMN_126693 [Dreissena polymorpha]|uniref:Uncharacterized protein n=1 Tax=Dreissena polymorpha TaxID=45954 RepID=A0A9D4JU66_DREPO|nr:hypothetical protein DPMN_126693 [Dreissena polymorpha]